MMAEPNLLLLLLLLLAGLAYALVTAVLASLAAYVEQQTAYHDVQVKIRQRELELARRND